MSLGNFPKQLLQIPRHIPSSSFVTYTLSPSCIFYGTKFCVSHIMHLEHVIVQALSLAQVCATTVTNALPSAVKIFLPTHKVINLIHNKYHLSS